jgi:hypothetical protein
VAYWCGAKVLHRESGKRRPLAGFGRFIPWIGQLNTGFGPEIVTSVQQWDSKCLESTKTPKKAAVADVFDSTIVTATCVNLGLMHVLLRTGRSQPKRFGTQK